MTSDDVVLNEHAIMEVLPHRYPFLLVDRVLELVPNKHIRALKNVSVNEPFFQGHFPSIKVMPGVLIIEAMAQAGGILAHQSVPDAAPKPLFYLVGVDKARFRKPVHPGDQLTIEMVVDRLVRGMWRFDGKVSVDGKPVVTATIMTAPGDETR